MHLLPDDGWQSTYDLTLALHVEAAEAAVHERRLRALMTWSNRSWHMPPACWTRSRSMSCRCSPTSHVTRCSWRWTWDCRYWRRLGLSLSQEANADAPRLPEPAELDKLPLMGSAEQLAAMRIMVALAPPAFQTRPRYLSSGHPPADSFQPRTRPLAAGRRVVRSVRLLSACRSGRRYCHGLSGRATIFALLQRFAAHELHSKVTFIFNGHIRHWCEPPGRRWAFY